MELAMDFVAANAGVLTAIAWLRWRIFCNTLRSTRAQLELFSQIIVSIAFGVLALGAHWEWQCCPTSYSPLASRKCSRSLRG